MDYLLRRSNPGPSRPTSVHLPTKPYNKDSPIVERSLSSIASTRIKRILSSCEKRDSPLKFPSSHVEKVKKQQKKLDSGFIRQEKYLDWKTKKVLSTIKKPKTEPDRQIIDKIKYDAIHGLAKKPPVLPDDDGNIIIERDVLPNGKTKMLYSFRLPRETKAAHRSVSRLFYWG